nr:hypothetical protein [Actinoplanes polyasparticus]
MHDDTDSEFAHIDRATDAIATAGEEDGTTVSMAAGWAHVF